MNKSGQLTIIVIIAIVIVAAILVFFLWVRPTYFVTEDASMQIQSCMEKVVKESSDKLGKTAGFINPELYYKYMDEKIGYVCYTNLYYQTCVVQIPFLKQHFEENLIKDSKEKIFNCYDSALDSLRAEGYDVSSGNKEVYINIEPGRMIINLNAPASIGRDSSSRKYANFTTQINSPMYDILMISQTIEQFEVTYGDSDTSSLMFYYPNLIITKLKQSDGTKVYVVEDKNTKNKFQFATRSLAWPAGYGSDTGLVRKQ